MNNTVLEQGLAQRQRLTQQAKDYLVRTRQLFDELGSEELKTTLSQFNELADALDSSNVRLVILGEFSRGKSTLLNALLGIELLPTAMEATTAINTFIRALPPGRTDRHIKVHYQDGRPAEEIPWSDDKALVRWGTELDTGHADVRKTLDSIEVFMENPLLEKGLVLIDTPGLQSVVAHHEQVTRKAIAAAHIALWVQNTTQLGGAATEWAFLAETLRTQFRKFITVIGWWDKVLEPEDLQDQQKTEAVRVEEKLEKVRDNFRKHLSDPEEIKLLTGPEHLIPVSAKWATSDDPAKVIRSGMDRLAARITALMTSGEALDEIYRKPLQTLTHIQQQLAASLKDELQQLAADKTLNERQRELELFEKDIQLLEQEADGITRDSREEHERAARTLVEKIRQQLITPLLELKLEIEDRVDARYIQRMIAGKVDRIRLPEDLDVQFQHVSQQVNKVWDVQKQELVKTLAGLRVQYAHQMEKQVDLIKGELSEIDIDMPALDVSLNLDFSDIEQHHRQRMELEQQINVYREKLEQIEDEMANHHANEAQIQLAREAVARQERFLQQLGPQPSATISHRQEKVGDSGMYGRPEYAQVAYTDDTNQKNWKDLYDERSQMLNDKEVWLDKIIAEEQRKTGIRISREKAQKKYEKELADLEKKLKKLQEQEQESQASCVQTALQSLIGRTAGQIDQRIHYLENHVAEAIHGVFQSQLTALEAFVREQYLEPLNAKRAKWAEIQALLQKSQADIDAHTAQLERGQKDIEELAQLTLNALQAREV